MDTGLEDLFEYHLFKSFAHQVVNAGYTYHYSRIFVIRSINIEEVYLIHRKWVIFKFLLNTVNTQVAINCKY